MGPSGLFQVQLSVDAFRRFVLSGWGDLVEVMAKIGVG